MKQTILVVDDSWSVRQLVSFTLSSAGYEVMEASDGADALSKLTGQEIHLIICDVNMPNMDGISFVKEVKKSEKYKFTPIIMLTTESQEAKRQQGKVAGATGWIVKPFNPEQLLTVVKKVLG